MLQHPLSFSYIVVASEFLNFLINKRENDFGTKKKNEYICFARLWMKKGKFQPGSVLILNTVEHGIEHDKEHNRGNKIKSITRGVK